MIPEHYFVTTRMIVRPFQPQDLPALARINADPEVSQFVGDGQPLSEQQTQQWIETSRSNVAQHGYGTGAVVSRNTGELIGWAGIARPPDDEEEVIYGLDKPWWGEGYGTELLLGLICWCKEELGLHALRATVDEGNSASIQMLKNQGFNLQDSCYQGEQDVHLYLLTLYTN